MPKSCQFLKSSKICVSVGCISQKFAKRIFYVVRPRAALGSFTQSGAAFCEICREGRRWWGVAVARKKRGRLPALVPHFKPCEGLTTFRFREGFPWLFLKGQHEKLSLRAFFPRWGGLPHLLPWVGWSLYQLRFKVFNLLAHFLLEHCDKVKN